MISRKRNRKRSRHATAFASTLTVRLQVPDRPSFSIAASDLMPCALPWRVQAPRVRHERLLCQCRCVCHAAPPSDGFPPTPLATAASTFPAQSGRSSSVACCNAASANRPFVLVAGDHHRAGTYPGDPRLLRRQPSLCLRHIHLTFSKLVSIRKPGHAESALMAHFGKILA
jgi:hypothetical protein